MKTATLNRTDAFLREHLLYLLNGDGWHADFAAAVDNLPAALRGKRPHPQAHTAWQLLEHVRITQQDVLEGILDPKHTSPESYWPASEVPKNEATWNDSIKDFQTDFKKIVELVNQHADDLHAPLKHAPEQTIARRLTVLADHASYHLGQLVMVRKMLGSWGK